MKLLQSTYQRLSSLDQVDLVLKATLVLFLFSEWVIGDDWRYMTPILILSGFGLIIPQLHRNKYLWYSLALVLVFKTIENWWSQDNHLFVNTYWVILIAFSLSFKNSLEIIRKNSKLLIGLVFLFATIWKIISPDFTPGTYFHYTFITDTRFAEESQIIGNITLDDMQSNISSVRKVAVGEETDAKLITNDTIKSLTRLVTWHTIIIESLLAILFLLPSKLRIASARNYVLIIFALTTYLAMPIHSFAWLLLAIGIVQTTQKEKVARVVMIVCWPLMLIYKYVPFMQWLAEMT